MDIGAPELIIVLVIVLLLFGPERIGRTLGEMGKGVRSFRDGLSGKSDEKPAAAPESAQVLAQPTQLAAPVKPDTPPKE